MAADPDAIATKIFLAEACSRSLLAPQQAEELCQEAQTRGLAVSQLAVEKGVMDPLDVDIVQTLLRRQEAIPGYEILDVLGRGGMGVVYRARQRNLDRVVAIKTVLLSQLSQSGSVARFEQEARTVARLRHPNIVTAFDFGRHESRLFFVMELLEGQDLEDRIERQGRLDEAFAWGVARQAAAGLAHAGQLGIVHRDIKPANLFLVAPPDGFSLAPGLPMVKITDFGLVLQTGLSPLTTRLTQAGMTLGTPLYMAPEQYHHTDVDSRADIYGLGATVYHMLLGLPPFAGRNFAQVVAQKTNQETPRLPAPVSPESAALVARMMARDPEQRLASYSELLDQIDRLPVSQATMKPASLHHLSAERITEEMPASLPDIRLMKTALMPAQRWRQRGKRVALLALPIVALLLVLAWYGWQHGRNGALASIPALVLSGHGQALFDGASLTGWIVDEGGWTPEKDAEGGQVLAGNGIIRRPLPGYGNFRLSLEVDLLKASAIEVHFGIGQKAAGNDERYVLRVAADGVMLGKRPTNRGPLHALSAPLPFPPPPDPAAGPRYRELRVEHWGAMWRAYFDNQLVGQVPVLDNAPLAEIRLATEGGPAHFGAMEIVELVNPEQSRSPAP